MWWKGVSTTRGSSAPFLASLSASSFPVMFVWALTFLMVILCDDCLMAFIMCVMRSLSGWLFWEEGCLMWLSRRYMMLRLSVKMNVSVVMDLVCSIANSNAYSYALSIFG